MAADDDYRDEAMRAVADLDHSGTAWPRTTCPFCLRRTGKPDRRKSLSYNQEIGLVKCFKCGIRVWLQGKVDFKKAPQDAPKHFFSKKAPSWYYPLFGDATRESISLAPGVAYAESRGFDEALRAAVGMGGAVTGKFRERIIVPHQHANGSWWGFSARSWVPKHDDGFMPHRYPTAMTRDYVYNQAALSEDVDDPVMLEEGVLDCLQYWPDSVGALGKPTRKHLELFKASRRPIAVVLDADAWRQGWYYSILLRKLGIPSGSVRLPPGCDPNSIHQISVADVRRAAEECIGKPRPVDVKLLTRNFVTDPVKLSA